VKGDSNALKGNTNTIFGNLIIGTGDNGVIVG